MLVDGVPGNLISIRDRGLLYGDGVFRTLRIVNGQPECWPLHFAKLQHDCEALGISCPSYDVLTHELSGLLKDHAQAVCKIIVTRGQAVRGYAPQPGASHIWDASPLPLPQDNAAKLILCKLRLSHQPRLAGIKHLNRLENVLAAAECIDADEGLLQDVAGHVIEGVRSNVFLIRQGRLITPDLSLCGVAGVQRDRVISAAAALGVPVEIRRVELDEVSLADEVFLSNSVFGIRPVACFEQRSWTDFSGALQYRAILELDDHG